MKRTNLVLDEHVLNEARAISGLGTYSAVVNAALLEFIRRRVFARIDDYAGSDVWDGDLGTMKSDRGMAVREAESPPDLL